MPKSKRAKVVHLSKVGKKGQEVHRRTFAAVQECAERYPYIYVLSVSNMRTSLLQELRSKLPDSRYVSPSLLVAFLSLPLSRSLHAPR